MTKRKVAAFSVFNRYVTRRDEKQDDENLIIPLINIEGECKEQLQSAVEALASERERDKQTDGQRHRQRERPP